MKIKKSILIEVILSQNNSISFPNFTTLDKKKIVAIEAFSVAQVTKTPGGKTVASAADVSEGFLTMVNKSSQKILDKHPINSFIVSLNSGQIKEFDGLEIDFSQTELFFPVPANLTDSEAIPFVIYYED